MHLITPLACGVSGAASGSAKILKRSALTKTTWYSDFEGTNSYTTDVTLDANGGAVVYVNELVVVRVYDVAGSLVREFTAGADAPAVEVKSQSFTGANYTTGTAAAGEPTTLQAALDKWFTSAGAVDFKLLVNGAATNLSTFAANLISSTYNVQDTAYGAVGDGVTDDTSAIQGALNAANTAGGGVVFLPAGTYFVTATLTVYDKTTLVGEGKGLSIVLVDADIAGTGLTTDASSTTEFDSFSIRFDATRVGSPELITFAGTYATLLSCEVGFTSGTNESNDALRHTAGDLLIQNCDLYANVGATGTGGTCAAYVAATSASQLWLRDSRITTTGTGAGGGTTVDVMDLSALSNAYVSGCAFDSSSITTNMNVEYLQPGASTTLLITGSKFTATGGSGDARATAGAAGATIRFAACALSGVVPHQGSASNFSAAAIRDRGAEANNDASYTVYPWQYEHFQLSRTSAGAQTINFDTSVTPLRGSEFVLVVDSTGGVTPVISFGTGVLDVSGFTLGASDYRVCRFVFTDGSWVESGTSADTA